MEIINKYSKWIMIILCVLFLGGSMKTCSRGRQITKLEKTINQKDSAINACKDTITALKHDIEVLETKNSGIEQSLKLQGEAINQIAEAKKNVNVVLKGRK